MSWSNNAGSLEGASQKITISNSNKTNFGYSSTSITLAPSGTYWVQSIFDNNVRSVDTLSSTFTVSLTNTESDVTASKSKAFKVQYKPTEYAVVSNVENQGKTIAIDNDSKTTIKWTYPYNKGASGVVSGFTVQVYADSNYSDLVSTHDVPVSYSTYITGPTYSLDLDNATDLRRGVMNYFTITPYYTYPSNGNKSVGETLNAGKLIKPYKFMSKPVISYPINNTTWHNKQFRVLLRLNEDRDYDTYSSSIKSAYAYSDMEIKINGVTYAFSGKYTSLSANDSIFSSDINKANTNNHMKYMAINPSIITGFADANTFKIQIRIQRGNYYFTDAEMRGTDTLGTPVVTWSDWSNEITLNKSAIVAQSLNVGDEIKASHFNTLHDWGLRLLACYPIKSKDSRDVSQVSGNYIEGSNLKPNDGEYLGVYQTMLNLIEGVNSYCSYDRKDVKFNHNIPEFVPKTEIITSAESGTDRYGTAGRNYINLLTRYLNDYLQ